MNNVIVFVNTKLIPFISAITSTLPGLLSSNAADVTTAVGAIEKLVVDIQSDISALVSAIRSAE